MKRVGLAGWPVKHSRSPLIHGHWIEAHGIAARYDLLPVPPEDAAAFFADLDGAGLAGLNVTVPHKLAAARAVRVDEIGARLGSTNLLWRAADGWHGTSSDGLGFTRSLDADAPRWRDAGTALVVGAGGAAIAAADALAAAGLAVVVANRSADRAEALARQIGGRAVAWDEVPAALHGIGLLVNATTLGMDGNPALPLDLAPLPAGAIVTDLVYNPLETPLLAAARARGLAAVDGLGMLLHQASEAFERWFGVRPAVTPELRAKVVATL